MDKLTENELMILLDLLENEVRSSTRGLKQNITATQDAFIPNRHKELYELRAKVFDAVVDFKGE
jgi:hypothetical protein